MSNFHTLALSHGKKEAINIVKAQVRAFARSNGIAWPGGYPLYAVTADGAVLSAAAVRGEYRQVIRATKSRDTHSGWCIDAIGVHWEGEPLVCEHTGATISSAYGER
jgi:hypothetical protein